MVREERRISVVTISLCKLRPRAYHVASPPQSPAMTTAVETRSPISQAPEQSDQQSAPMSVPSQEEPAP